MATYAAMIDRMDQGIGRVLAKLDALSITDDTLIIFLSDNGGCAEYMAEDGRRDHRSYVPTLPDGTRVRIGNRVDMSPGPADTFHELRSALGERLQFAFPPLQTLGA